MIEHKTNDPLLTIAMITMSHSNRLVELAQRYALLDRVGVVIVNQSDTGFAIDKTLELRPSVRLSASRARNYAYCNSSSKFIIFLDEDASISAAHLEKLCCVLDEPSSTSRMYLLEGKTQRVMRYNNEVYAAQNIFRYIKFYCEWNCVYNRSHIIGRPFRCIGVGSRNIYWSGEGLLSLAELKYDAEVRRLIDIKVNHPPLSDEKPLDTCIKYQYGYGYAMGCIFVEPKFWLVRLEALLRFLASIVGLLIKPIYFPSPTGTESKLIRLYYIQARCRGFFERLTGVISKNEV